MTQSMPSEHNSEKESERSIPDRAFKHGTRHNSTIARKAFNELQIECLARSCQGIISAVQPDEQNNYQSFYCQICGYKNTIY